MKSLVIIIIVNTISKIEKLISEQHLKNSVIVAIPVNFIAKKIGLVTWYDFLVFNKSIGFLDGIFMFIVYPLIFGAVIYFLD